MEKHHQQTNPTLTTRTRASGESAPYPDVIIHGYGGQVSGVVPGVPVTISAVSVLDVGGATVVSVHIGVAHMRRAIEPSGIAG